jgi:hypothetical protein
MINPSLIKLLCVCMKFKQLLGIYGTVRHFYEASRMSNSISVKSTV